MAGETGLSPAFSETPKIGFVTSRSNYDTLNERKIALKVNLLLHQGLKSIYTVSL